jgi:hypothetical protein
LASGEPSANGRLPAALGALALALAGCAPAASVSAPDVVTLRAWAHQQHVPAGEVRGVRLPPGTIGFTPSAPVKIVHLKDGRTCFLLITKLEYKDNFEGVLSCTLPLRASENVPAHDTYAPSVSLSNCIRACGVFEELYVRRARDDRTYDVYFDLN